MSKRNLTIDIDPGAYAAVRGLEKYISESGLDKIHYKLIKIRASQMNGCAFCIDKHTREARELGLSEQRIYLLNAWRETELYTEEERAILALTEEVTSIANHGVSDEVYNNAVALFGEAYTKAVVMGVITINAWNRIAITDQLPLK
ncbi:MULTISPECIES: carboxymuconolactone decarboxylase family protein [Dyadobacter]|uniref:Carboxymuconolactone decarboxylase family protein n=1 Tax=Dyadobacter chenhuakuii TaxID=2909339 RepID=A0ABY4XJT6_9BACT|nr:MULTISPECIES: carboxymuconolactone decarboxylase family protein [Dyadobacter]MCE7071725.1 carboxymuconolactone decarboxylase family protein [Dyadobacter sp. CY327]MCF2496449.1 carboxymuconolactone decarboxylase family protein [Dyadobacter chenhuakuii]USJ30506.1 carboxymuconolactone decarboxylase family protein [Dyadobacter chenhuakuii]